MPGMAFSYASDGQPRAFQRAMQLHGFARISRAGRIKPALRAEKRRQQVTIGVNQRNQQGFHGGLSISLRVLEARCTPSGTLL